MWHLGPSLLLLVQWTGISSATFFLAINNKLREVKNWDLCFGEGEEAFILRFLLFVVTIGKQHVSKF